jgi:hypothetical protein
MSDLKEGKSLTTVRAKFVVASVEETVYSKTVKLHFQYSNNLEDNSFAKATPSGNCTLTIDNPEVKGFFKPGKAFYADFTAAD